MPTKRPFTVKSNEPTILEVEAADGRRWQLSMRLGILEVVDTGKPHPNLPAVPLFDLQVTMVTDTKPVR